MFYLIDVSTTWGSKAIKLFNILQPFFLLCYSLAQTARFRFLVLLWHCKKDCETGCACTKHCPKWSALCNRMESCFNTLLCHIRDFQNLKGDQRDKPMSTLWYVSHLKCSETLLSNLTICNGNMTRYHTSDKRHEVLLPIGNFHDGVIWLQLPELFKFCIPSGVKITIALFSIRQRKPKGFWYL